MISRVRSIVGSVAFVVRNLAFVRKIGAIEKQEFDGLRLRGYVDADFHSVSEIYSNLNRNSSFSGLYRSLYRRIGKRCLFLVEQENVPGMPIIVGMNMYYLNKRDVLENTMHEGFIGVLPEVGGRGIATKMRQMASQHFKAAGFSGISTRISLSNAASLASAEKIGFQPIEEYFEPSTGEQRYYMVCQL